MAAELTIMRYAPWLNVCAPTEKCQCEVDSKKSEIDRVVARERSQIAQKPESKSTLGSGNWHI